MPMVTLRVCSRSRGQIRVNSARLVKSGACGFAVAAMKLLLFFLDFTVIIPQNLYEINVLTLVQNIT